MHTVPRLLCPVGVGINSRYFMNWRTFVVGAMYEEVRTFRHMEKSLRVFIFGSCSKHWENLQKKSCLQPCSSTKLKLWLLGIP